MSEKYSSNGDAIDRRLGRALTAFEARHPKSLEFHQFAARYMPGGNTRTVIWHEPFPLRIVSGDGPMLTDADGFEYVDFLGEYTAGLFGHSHPVIRRATREALDGGLSFGAHNQYEVRFSQLLCERFRNLESLRFTNSGTEANLMAISASRAFAGRSKVMVFRGGYHGGVFYFGAHNSPLNAPFPWLIAPYNDLETAQGMLQRDGGEIACVLVEPMQGSAGCIPAHKAFLRGLREACDKAGVLLIFDEVMTSRLGAGGAGEMYGVKPDLMTLGKYLGGGFSFGAFGGRQDIMARFDPSRADPWVHPGTFQNNVMTMRAGVAVLEEIYTSEAADAHFQYGENYRERLNRSLERAGAGFRACGLGSLMNLHPTTSVVADISALQGLDDRLRLLLFLGLLERGYYIARRGFLSLSLMLEDGHLDGFESALLEVLSEPDQAADR